MIVQNPSRLEKSLYVGFDDSNHAGVVEKEIIVGIFSRIPEDNLIQKFPEKRNYKKVINWMQNPNRDYRLTTLEHNSYFRNSYNLQLTAIYLVEDYLKSVENSNLPKKIYLNFDGLLKTSWKDILKNDFADFRLKMRNFKGKTKRSCPKIVYIADVFSNYLFKSKSSEEISREKRFVTPPREIYRREKLFRT